MFRFSLIPVLLLLSFEGSTYGETTSNDHHVNVPGDDFTLDNKQEIQAELRNVLGLPERNQLNTKLSGGSAPQSLLNFYKYSTQKQADMPIAENLKKSDFLTSYNLMKDYVTSGMRNGGKRIWYKILNDGMNRELVGAELRLYQSVGMIAENDKNSFQLTISRIHRSKQGHESFHYQDKYIGMVNNTTPWITLNVTEALQYWLQNPSKNYGFELTITSDNHASNIIPEEVGIAIDNQDVEKQPSLIGYFKNDPYQSQPLRKIIENRVKREISTKQDNNYDHFKDQLCARRELYINFTDLGMRDVIMEPEGYTAYFCSGTCRFPLHGNIETTSHSIIQAHMNLLHPEIPLPCCVPTVLSDLHVVARSSSGNIVMESKKDMVVEACGCL